MSGKKITIYLHDGLSQGVREVKIDQWSGKAICGPRSQIKEILKLNELSSGACLYFLTGESAEGELLNVYVGEADPFSRRIKNHVREKDWWQNLVVFINNDSTLTKTGAKYLEKRCIETLQGLGKCNLDNGNNPEGGTVPKEDIPGLEFFLDNIALTMPLLGFDIFAQETEKKGREREFICENKSKKVVAKGILLPDGKMKVLKGSFAVMKNAPAFNKHNYKKLKDELIGKKRIDKFNNKLIFTEDYIFNSSSAAAAIILARSASGPLEWKNKKGKTLKEITEQ